MSERTHYDDPEIIGPEETRSETVQDGFWETVRKAARRIPFMDEVVAAYFCAFDPSTPARVRGTLLAALAYFVVPFDFVPDFILGLGFTDDVTVLATTIALVQVHITDVHRTAARNALADPSERSDTESEGPIIDM